jgi:predicted DNA-binding transcriptional regulator AlpA
MIDINGIQYISDKEASYRYGYSQSWFQKVRYDGNGPAFVRLNGKGKVLYPVIEMDEWFRSNLVRGE